MRLCILVRHCESNKNATSAFAADAFKDELTQKGEDSAVRLSDELSALMHSNRGAKWALFYAPSQRAELTAQKISETLGIPAAPVEAFKSIHAGVIAGVTEEAARSIAPDYMRGLVLYRFGLVSSYDLAIPEGAERLELFESRITIALTQILEQWAAHNVIIVAHRSPITAILIHFARAFYNYPRAFFGYVPLEAGAFSVVRLDDSGGEILGINCTHCEDLRSNYVRAPKLESMSPTVLVMDGANSAEAIWIKDALHAYNQNIHKSLRLTFTVVSQNSRGDLIGGCVAYVHWQTLCIQAMWVDKDVRGQGVGSNILRKAETEGIRKGAKYAWLDTFSWQAQGFYEKHGYVVFGQVPYVGGIASRIFMKKQLASP